MESTTSSTSLWQKDFVMKSNLDFACVEGEIEVLFQETFLKDDGIPELPVIEDGPFVYQIVRRDGVAIFHSIIDFFSVPRSDLSASAASTIEDTVADHETDQTIVELVSEEDADDEEDEDEEGSESQHSTISDGHHDQETIIRCSELIEVDQVIKQGDNVILRLADQSGWVAAHFGGGVAARRVGVERGLWSWCVDNYPDGITVRSHPMDSPDLLPSERHQIRKGLNRTILPLQRIYCDMRVKHPTTGVVFYRLQSCSVDYGGECIVKHDNAPIQQVMSGKSIETEEEVESTVDDEYTIVSSMRDKAKMTFHAAATFSSQGWVFERARAHMRMSESCISIRRWLIDDNLVKLNLYAIYQALTDDLFIQAHTDVTYNSQRVDALRIKKGDMVVVKAIRHSPEFKKDGNGPFLYLADGSGWLYENRNHHQVMKAVPLAKGCWECIVQNNNLGCVCTSRHPMVAQEGFFTDKVAFSGDSVIQCDRKVTNVDNGISFYRVVGSDGWIPDKIGARITLDVLSYSPSVVTEDFQNKATSANGWTADFVRGILATEPSYREENYEENSCVMTFVHIGEKTVRLNIFLKTQTVGYVPCPSTSDSMKASKIQKCKRNCSAKDLLEIIQKHGIEDDYLGNEEINHGEEKKEIDDIDLVATNLYDDKNFREDRCKREKEEELRQQLLVCDNEINIMTTYRRHLLRQVTFHDELRAVELRKIFQFDTAETSDSENNGDSQVELFQAYRKSKNNTLNDGALSFAGISTASDILSFLKKTSSTIQQLDSLESENIVDVRNVRANRSGISDSASAMLSVGSSRKQFLCGECHRTFNGKYSRDIHCREIHGLVCTVCEKIFESRKQLDAHLLNGH